MEACETSLNDGTTERHVSNVFLKRIFKKQMFNLRWELSVPEKCCCLPLRRGFLVLAYLKLVLSVVLFLGILHFLLLMYVIFSREEMFNHCVAWAAISIDVLDIVLGVVIIKNAILMEMYYRCSIYVFGLLSILCCLVFHLMHRDIYALLIIILLFILVILMQVYLNQMVKSEVLKLKSISQFEILNNDQEPFCTYINNVDN